MANRRWTIAVGLVCAALGFGDKSKADSLAGTYGDEIVETQHRARLELDGRVAAITVTRTIENRGDHSDEARMSIELPDGGTVVGLRVRSRGKWIKGIISESKAAQAEYDRLTSSGKAGHDGPALMAWVAPESVELSVFPVAKGHPRQVEYTVRATTCYRDGLRIVAYPKSDLDAGVDVRADKGRVFAELKKAPLRVTDAIDACTEQLGAVDDHVWVAFEAPVSQPLGTAFASYRTGFEQNISRLEIDAREQLSAKPKGAKVVFVIDASHTQGTVGIAVQLELAKAYMEHLPDATFEVVAYRRYAERVLGEFARGKDAASVLSGIRPAALIPNNGSNLDAGLALAASLLEDTDRPARVVAFTDSRLRVDFDNSEAIAAFSRAPKQTVLHIVDNPFDLASVSFGRFDGHDLAGIAGAFGGIVISPTGDASWDDTETAMLALVRPLQIDSFSIAGLEVPAPSVLREGESVRYMDVLPSTSVPSSLTIHGKLWARDVSRTISIDPALTAEMPALVFGTSLWETLVPESVESIARAGKAVSPKTSYLAVNPKLGPSSTDYLGGISGCSCCGGCSIGCRGCCGIGTIGRGVSKDEPDLNALLAAWLEPSVRACEALHDTHSHETRVNFELHSQEIADLAVDSNGSDDFRECISDAAWQLQLDSHFYRSFDRRIVSL